MTARFATALLLVLSSCTTQEETVPSPPEIAPLTAEEIEWKSMLERSSELFGEGRPAESAEVARGALDFAEESFGPEDERTVHSMLALASILIQTRQLDQARELTDRALEICETTGKQSTLLATTLKYRGSLQMLGGDMQGARETFTRAVRLSETILGPEHTETAKHLGNLASVTLQAGDVDAAREQLQRALAIWEAQPQPDPVYTVGAMTHLARLRLVEDEPDAALELYARGLAIQEEAFGYDSARLANLLRNFAQLLRRTGHTEQAAEVDQRLAALPGQSGS